MRDISESDWKTFKMLHAVALERYFMRAVAGMLRKLGNARKTNRERFWDCVSESKRGEKEVRAMFDDFRRSTAVFQLLRMRKEGLIREEEMARFSERLRQTVKKQLEDVRR